MPTLVFLSVLSSVMTVILLILRSSHEERSLRVQCHA